MQRRDQVPVYFHRLYCSGGLRQEDGQAAQASADLEHFVGRPNLRRLHDFAQAGWINQKVLTE